MDIKKKWCLVFIIATVALAAFALKNGVGIRLSPTWTPRLQADIMINSLQQQETVDYLQMWVADNVRDIETYGSSQQYVINSSNFEWQRIGVPRDGSSLFEINLYTNASRQWTRLSFGIARVGVLFTRGGDFGVMASDIIYKDKDSQIGIYYVDGS